MDRKFAYVILSVGIIAAIWRCFAALFPDFFAPVDEHLSAIASAVIANTPESVIAIYHCVAHLVYSLVDFLKKPEDWPGFLVQITVDFLKKPEAWLSNLYTWTVNLVSLDWFIYVLQNPDILYGSGYEALFFVLYGWSYADHLRKAAKILTNCSNDQVNDTRELINVIASGAGEIKVLFLKQIEQVAESEAALKLKVWMVDVVHKYHDLVGFIASSSMLHIVLLTYVLMTLVVLYLLWKLHKNQRASVGNKTISSGYSPTLCGDANLNGNNNLSNDRVFLDPFDLTPADDGQIEHLTPTEDGDLSKNGAAMQFTSTSDSPMSSNGAVRLFDPSAFNKDTSPLSPENSSCEFLDPFDPFAPPPKLNPTVRPADMTPRKSLTELVPPTELNQMQDTLGTNDKPSQEVNTPNKRAEYLRNRRRTRGGSVSLKSGQSVAGQLQQQMKQVKPEEVVAAPQPSIPTAPLPVEEKRVSSENLASTTYQPKPNAYEYNLDYAKQYYQGMFPSTWENNQTEYRHVQILTPAEIDDETETGQGQVQPEVDDFMYNKSGPLTVTQALYQEQRGEKKDEAPLLPVSSCSATPVFETQPKTVVNEPSQPLKSCLRKRKGRSSPNYTNKLARFPGSIEKGFIHCSHTSWNPYTERYERFHELAYGTRCMQGLMENRLAVAPKRVSFEESKNIIKEFDENLGLTEEDLTDYGIPSNRFDYHGQFLKKRDDFDEWNASRDLYAV